MFLSGNWNEQRTSQTAILTSQAKNLSLLSKLINKPSIFTECLLDVNGCDGRSKKSSTSLEKKETDIANKSLTNPSDPHH